MNLIVQAANGQKGRAAYLLQLKKAPNNATKKGQAKKLHPLNKRVTQQTKLGERTVEKTLDYF